MEDQDFSIVIRLRELRKEKKLSQEELAEALGISRQSIIALEQGKSLPSLPLAFNICKFFNAAIEQIFESPFILENTSKENNNKLIVSPLNEDRKEQIMPNELEPWRPYREMVSLRDAMDRLFEDSFITPRSASLMPKIDIQDKKDKVMVTAELPGMKEDDVEVEISDGLLTISGEKKEEKEAKEEGYYHKESFSGTFSRSVGLPSDVIGDKAEAEMKDGILTINIPKAAPKESKKLKIAKK